MKAWWVATAVVLSCGSLLQAEPLDLRQISAEAKWLAHVDFDAAQSAKVARAIRDEWLNSESAKQSIRKLREAIGTDLRQDLHSVTLYGSRFTPQGGVVILRAKVDRQRLLDYLKKMPDYRTVSHGDHELHAWTQAKGKKHEHTVTGCFYQPTVMVFGRDAAQVKAALDVLDGKLSSLAGSDSPLAAGAPSGTIFQAKAAGLSEAKIPVKSPLVRQTEFLSITGGEHQPEAFAQAKLVLKQPELAQQVKAVVEGLLAVAKLQHGENEDMMRVLQAVKVTGAEQTVTVQWRGPADDVLKLISIARMKQLKLNKAD